ncbi:MAG: hypothetical protein NT178_09770 [Proteobacteria bacterium]|nr:hypothetical protein [Pseudomonadota bacterium]
MKLFVNNKEVDLLPGMTVRHALIAADLLKDIAFGKKIFDEQGNEVGLDGSIEGDLKIYVR